MLKPEENKRMTPSQNKIFISGGRNYGKTHTFVERLRSEGYSDNAIKIMLHGKDSGAGKFKPL